MDRFPIIVTAGGMLLGWIAGTLAVADPAISHRLPEGEAVHHFAGVLGALLVLAVGKVLAARASDAVDGPAAPGAQ